MISKLKTGLMAFALIAFYLLGMGGVSSAENRALEQLLQVLEKRGAITRDEAKMIGDTLAEDQKRLSEKEHEIKDREKALTKKEADLREKEDALSRKEKVLAEKETPPSAEPLPVKEEGPKKEVAATTIPEEGCTEAADSRSGFPLEVKYDHGFCMTSPDEDRYSLCLGGLLQADYRYFSYNSDKDPEKNEFDIRRARLILKGHVLERFRYKFQYEFQGAGSRRLLDAYLDTRILPYLNVRVGQFKEPFSLEQYSSDKNIPFTERSMGYYLTPRRDVGLMAHAAFWHDRIYYGVGLFNGDGVDDTTGGDVDSPEFTGRLVFRPFKDHGISFLDGLQLGGSYSFAHVDRNNVNIEAKTPGLTTFFDVKSSAKFNIIREANARTRYGAELAWAYGPLLLWGEYVNLKFSDVKTSSDEFDINVTDYYGAIFWMITGERPTLNDGVIQAIRPGKALWQGGWGALGVAFRYDSFDGGDTAYDYLIQKGNSVREATSYTLALNWYLNPYVAFYIDAARTYFDSPLLIARDALTSVAIYSDREDVFTGRLQFRF